MLNPGRSVCNLAATLAGVLALLYITYKLKLCENLGFDILTDGSEQIILYDKDIPLTFISAVPYSGAYLLHALLDAHPDIRCSHSVRMPGDLIDSVKYWHSSETEKQRLELAGLGNYVLSAAVAAFFLQLFALHGAAAPRLCYEDSYMLLSGDYVGTLFPQARFLFLVRDARAVVHWNLTEKGIPSDDIEAYRSALNRWNEIVSTMYSQCQKLGQDRCLLLHYEQLVLHPEYWTRQILSYLDATWNERLLYKLLTHSDIWTRFSVDTLAAWVGEIPERLVHDMDTLAPMLATLGYDPRANPPNYGVPDAAVV